MSRLREQAARAVASAMTGSPAAPKTIDKAAADAVIALVIAEIAGELEARGMIAAANIARKAVA